MTVTSRTTSRLRRTLCAALSLAALTAAVPAVTTHDAAGPRSGVAQSSWRLPPADVAMSSWRRAPSAVAMVPSGTFAREQSSWR
jgi:hypothetical protein